MRPDEIITRADAMLRLFDDKAIQELAQLVRALAVLEENRVKGVVGFMGKLPGAQLPTPNVNEKVPRGL